MALARIRRSVTYTQRSFRIILRSDTITRDPLWTFAGSEERVSVFFFFVNDGYAHVNKRVNCERLN